MVLTVGRPAVIAVAILIALELSVAAFAILGQSAAQWTYPPTKIVDATDTYFGKSYRDPYRWLEDLKSKDVETWFKLHADLTDSVLAKIPGRDALTREWMDLDKLTPATYSTIIYEHGRVFYKKALGGENVGKLYFREGWKGAEKLLFDPAGFTPRGAKPGDVATIESFTPSPDGRHVVLALSAEGAAYVELRCLEVDSGRLLPESIYPSRDGSLGWTMDSHSFFYTSGRVTDIRSPEILLNRQTRLHRLGSDTATDVDVFSNESYPDLGIAPRENPFASIDESYPDYIIGNVWTVQNEMRLFYAPTSQLKTGARIKWSVLATPADNLVQGIAFYKHWIYAVTHTGAPKYKIIRTNVEHPDWNTAETVVPEARDSIKSITKSKSFLFVVYSDGIVGRLLKYGLDMGKAAEVRLPASGTIDISCPDFRTNQCILLTTSWIQPTTLYDFDAEKDTFTRSIFNTAGSYPGLEDLVTEEVEVPGYDGTMIPLSIVRRKDLKLDGSSSAILMGYGSYGVSATPAFDVKVAMALHRVVLATAHVRGGGEKGETWHKAGYKTTKPNTWRDFISSAEYLTKKGYTSADKLAAFGTSAGGILISRAVTERPDLFAAAVCNVGWANAMRMEFGPIGPGNTPEFGTVQNAAEAQALYEMDGVQHVQSGVKYPAVLGVAGWNDASVAPWQPAKFVAALQAASTSGKPVLLKVNYDNGHFTEEKIVTFRNFAGQAAFLLWQTGHREFQPAR